MNNFAIFEYNKWILYVKTNNIKSLLTVKYVLECFRSEEPSVTQTDLMVHSVIEYIVVWRFKIIQYDWRSKETIFIHIHEFDVSRNSKK